jgi:hypothetical protein
MATTERLSPGVMRSIANQIAERSPAAPGSAAADDGAGPSLGESLKVHTLRLDRIRSGAGSLSERLQDTGQWHHQVYHGDRAMSFARSEARYEGPEAPHVVVEVARSSLPEDLQEAISWIDENVDDEAVASVFIAPDYFLAAVWLKGPTLDAVVIATMADGLQGLERRTLIPSDVFLARLAENEPIAGLGPVGDRPEGMGPG